MTITRAGDILGNSMAFGAAWVATITQDDLRLWAIAIGGFAMSLVCNLPRIRQRKREAQAALYDAQKRRIQLCRECKQSNWLISSSCVVADKHRPSECPFGKIKNEYQKIHSKNF